VRLDRTLGPATTTGDPRLVERLAANLVDNALRHNTADGWVRITTGTEGGHAVLHMVNSGPAIPADRVDSLFQPFQRYEPRTGHADGHGLGLSIVAAVADAHRAEVAAVPGQEGGLDITVTFPPLP
jgi:K+-sensing histidine kinase KdpD